MAMLTIELISELGSMRNISSVVSLYMHPFYGTLNERFLSECGENIYANIANATYSCKLPEEPIRIGDKEYCGK